MIPQNQIKELISTALKARQHAFIFRTKSKVGAAVLTADDQIFIGANIDGLVGGQGSCAEIVALNNSAANGYYQIKAICVVSRDCRFPCGCCLQHLTLFSQVNDADIQIIAADTFYLFLLKVRLLI
jgi:cytidine deaminase